MCKGEVGSTCNVRWAFRHKNHCRTRPSSGTRIAARFAAVTPRPLMVSVMLINKENLISGIDYWRVKKPRWPDDFHNKVYKDLHQWRENGLSSEWWEKVTKLLQFWQANRPYSQYEIFNEGLPYLNQLDQEYKKIVSLKGLYPKLESLKKDEIKLLFEISQKIKKSKTPSPVFPSKLCHFIFPSALFVADREAVGVNFMDYFDYWSECKTLWVETENKENLIEILKRKISESQQFDSFFQYYPFGVKIAELCRIGNKNKA